MKGGSLGETLDGFVHNFGAPEHITFDCFQSQAGNNTKFFKIIGKCNIDHPISVPRCLNENPTEGAIREIKHILYQVMQQMKVTKRVWYYLEVWTYETVNLSVSRSHYAKG